MVVRWCSTPCRFSSEAWKCGTSSSGNSSRMEARSLSSVLTRWMPCLSQCGCRRNDSIRERIDEATSAKVDREVIRNEKVCAQNRLAYICDVNGLSEGAGAKMDEMFRWPQVAILESLVAARG